MEFVTSKRPGKHWVKGHTKANGTVVASYLRSYPAITRQVNDTAKCNVITTPNSNLPAKVRNRLKAFLRVREGFRPNPYQDSVGVWTVGHGDTKDVKPGETITLEQAEARLEKRIDEHKVGLDDVKRPLNDNEKIGLGSFLYNAGPKSLRGKRLLRRLNERDKLGTAIEMSDYLVEPRENNDAEDSVKGMVNRRLKEIEYMLTPDGETLIKLRKDLTEIILHEAGLIPQNASVKERKAWTNRVRKSARKHVEAEVRRILDKP